jgi:HK97 family phage prohead protease
MFEVKSFPVEIKANMDNGMFEGYCSVFGNIDSYNDIVMPGAFTKTIQENKNRIKILWQHDWTEPIGKPIEMMEDSKGLHVKGKISMTDVGQKALMLMRDGVINEMSIGYDTVKSDYDNLKGVRYLRELKLWEFSAVTFAANPIATIDSVKKLNFLSDLKSGRMISSANRNKIQAVIDALLALLVDDEPQEEPEEDMGCTPRKPEKSLKIDNTDSAYQSILAELKKY